jgi:hypothetical protein
MKNYDTNEKGCLQHDKNAHATTNIFKLVNENNFKHTKQLNSTFNGK